MFFIIILILLAVLNIEFLFAVSHLIVPIKKPEIYFRLPSYRIDFVMNENELSQLFILLLKIISYQVYLCTFKLNAAEMFEC